MIAPAGAYVKARSGDLNMKRTPPSCGSRAAAPAGASRIIPVGLTSRARPRPPCSGRPRSAGRRLLDLASIGIKANATRGDARLALPAELARAVLAFPVARRHRVRERGLRRRHGRRHP